MISMIFSHLFYHRVHRLKIFLSINEENRKKVRRDQGISWGLRSHNGLIDFQLTSNHNSSYLVPLIMIPPNDQNKNPPPY